MQVAEPSALTKTIQPRRVALTESEYVANRCHYKATDSQILAEIFMRYDFYLENLPMTPEEVFSNRGFLPFFSHYAGHRLSGMFGVQVEIGTVQADGTIFGVESFARPATSSDALVYMLQMISVVHEVIGFLPSRIDLDGLFEFAHSGNTLREDGIPYLGKPAS